MRQFTLMFSPSLSVTLGVVGLLSRHAHAAINCDVDKSGHVNATGSTPILGISTDNSTQRISSSSANWTFSTSLIELATAGKQINQDFQLDTSSTVAVNETVPYGACVKILTGAQKQQDGCVNDACLKALDKQARDFGRSTALQISQHDPKTAAAPISASDACSNFLSLTAPEECQGFAGSNASSAANSKRWSSALATGLSSLATKSNETCTTPRRPIELGGVNYLPDATNPDPYALRVRSSTPFVIALYQNATAMQALGWKWPTEEPWVEARTGCVRPSVITPGSRDPKPPTGKSAGSLRYSLPGAALVTGIVAVVAVMGA